MRNIPWIAANGVEAPNLGLSAPLKSKGGEGNLNLGRPPPVGHHRCGFPDPIPGGTAARLDLDVVHLYAEGVDSEEVVAPLIVEGVEDNADPVIGPGLIAVGEVRTDRPGIRIVGTKADVQAVRIVHHQDFSSDRCRGVFPRSDLIIEGR